MKQELENKIYDYLKANLPKDMSSMLIKGHTTDNRKLPYIYVDVGEIKPFAELEYSDGMFEASVNIAIADSAHDINYKEHFRRTLTITSLMEKFKYCTDELLINAVYFESDTDARDDNNIGSVLAYKAVVQYL